jgi:hypothetical protein
MGLNEFQFTGCCMRVRLDGRVTLATAASTLRSSLRGDKDLPRGGDLALRSLLSTAGPCLSARATGDFLCLLLHRGIKILLTCP